MEHYVWRCGPAAERSTKQKTQQDEQQVIALQEGQQFHNETVDKIEIALQMAEHTQASRRKENVNNKLHERHMVQQVNQNPYFQGCNYVDDLNIQEAFLRPRASNTELKGSN